MSAVSVGASAAPAASTPASGFRTDIQGLRAIAVLLVLAFHAGVPVISGGYVGVDVFFVISGFLITGLLLREVEATGRLNLGRFYARRARRLLPAAGLAMVGIAVITVAVLPITRWRDIAGDLLTSSVYVVNWRLAERSVDYLGAESAASPVQHFWTLAVEEQFYVVWPLLIVALAWWHRRTGSSLRRTLLYGLVTVAVTSFAWSVWMTTVDPERAYFVTTTRLWELALGGLLVFGVPLFSRWGRRGRAVLAWAGLAAVAAASVVFDTSTPFPGAAALLPTLGAAAVIVAGVGAAAPGAGPLLGLPVLQDVGAASYSLYLWHWPVLVGATAVWGSAEGGLWLPTAVLVVGFAAVPAWFAYRVVERPIHESTYLAGRVRAPLLVGALCMLLGVGAAMGVQVARDLNTREAIVRGDLLPDGARVLGDDPVASSARGLAEQGDLIVPPPADAADDIGDPALQECDGELGEETRTTCTVGDPDGALTVAVVGDSHVGHWQPALQQIAEDRGWRLELLMKSNCGFFDARTARGEPPVENVECRRYDRALMDRLLGPHRPDVIVASGSNNYRLYDGDELRSVDSSRGLLAEAYQRRWEQVLSAGVEIVVIRNTPWVETNIPECVALNAGSLGECAVDRGAALERSGDSEVRAAAVLPAVNLVDMNDWICPAERCPAVIGDALVYRDGHHLTATYVRTLVEALDAALLSTGEFTGSR